MDTLKLVSTIVQVLASLFLIAVVLLQSGKRSGLSGAIAGAAESFMAKNKARTWDARLARVTKWVAALFLLFTLALNLFPVTPPTV
ncbi:MAG: preprotein translocase subunit SecG [Oscillospiraceae bacterium]|jgi:preprotein translocase subunit SecG|nr:preprotein translocase subunit SecG [Oscillospiraceae bacterium]